MAVDGAKHGLGRSGPLNPMRIARHTLFTAREKLDLLNRLKAEAKGSKAESNALAFAPEEIEQAIIHVRNGSARDADRHPPLRGDF